MQQLTEQHRANTIGGGGGKGSEAATADPNADGKLHVAASLARGGDKPGAEEDEHSHLDFQTEAEAAAAGGDASDDNVDPEAEEGPYKGGNYAIVWKVRA
jgi:hypothetical protein